MLNLGLGLVGMALVAKDRSSETGRMLLNLFCLTAFSYLSILPHELAHAIVGKLVGFRIVDVSIGSGATLFTIRGLTFPVRIKAVPFGGFTFGQPIRFNHLRSRFFVFVGAGPAINFIVGAIAWLLTGDGPSLTQTSTLMNVFVLANFLIAAENLVPFTFTSPEHGRLQSDGLILLRLLYPGKLPLTPRSSTSSESHNSPRRFLQIAGTVFLLLLAVGCATMTLWIAMEAPKQRLLWYGALVFALITVSLIWLSWRAWSHNPIKSVAPHSYDGLVAIYNADVTDFRSSECKDKILALNSEVTAFMARQNFQAALDQTEKALAEFGTNLFLLTTKATLLSAQKRFREAYEILNTIRARDDLRPETRTMIGIEAVKSLLRNGQMDQARGEIEVLLANAGTTIEKVFALDSFASLPIYESFPTLVADALQWSERALALQPGSLTMRATKACLLFEAGNLEASEANLNEVYALSESQVDKALTSFYLALIRKRRKQPQEGLSLARRAIRHCDIPGITTRLKAEFPEVRL